MILQIMKNLGIVLLLLCTTAYIHHIQNKHVVRTEVIEAGATNNNNVKRFLY